ncbi:Cyclic nucleotide-gated cation channel beta-1 [Schistosoma japonicum]|uniref:Cyclic nucleotide-gated cation channel beta-1 n=1 Tax=Schistosoma japonicum TaxID=6182 RepID=A0A4Z2DBT1_SCHJA|nr:Cyclic nucleotide-gated cation channel beta-1 [Schistosoma japonicum]
MLYIIHLETCGYYAFNRWQGLGETSWTIQPGRISPYVYSFYVCMKTATSIGSLPAATNSAEFLFMTCYWLSGILVSAILIGQVIDILDSASANKVNYRKVMDATLSSMQQLHAPQHVVNKVRSWFMYNWDQQKTFNENSLFECLPIKLKSDLAISVHYHTLSKVTLFQNCEKALIYDMILKLKPVVFLPMDYICRKGEVGKEMYIVKSGFVEVVGGPNNSIVFVTLKEGSVFGEISLLALSGKNRRTADVRSKGFSTLFSLSKHDFEEIMKNYPQAHELLKKRSQRMLNRDKKKANDEATKEKKKARREKSREINDDDAIIEVIPERPATPKLLETVVKAIETVYPDKLITKRLKGSFSNEFEMRRRSVYTVKPNYMITSTKSSNLTTNENTSTDVNEKECEQTSIGNSIPCQNDSRTQQSLNNSPKKDDIHDDKDNETDKESENLDQSFINERTTQQWIDMLSVGRNPIKRITSYFPHMLKKSWD